MEDEKSSPAFDTIAATEDEALESLGYEPELRRDFSLIGIVAFSFSIVTSWTALSGTLIVGVESGGKPNMTDNANRILMLNRPTRDDL